jgi:hypothetical protein
MSRYPGVYAHPRSGLNFLRAQLKASFYPDDPRTERRALVSTGHWAQRYRIAPGPGWIFARHHIHACYRGQRGLYIYRDGRDVAVSLWRSKTFQHPTWGNLSFSEFLQRPLDWTETPRQQAAPRLTIAEHWRQHVDGWLGGHPGVCCVRYENLLRNPAPVLDRIGAFIKRDVRSYQLQREPVGPDTHGGGWGAWRDVFTADDLTYFYSIVPNDHEALWRFKDDNKTLYRRA